MEKWVWKTGWDLEGPHIRRLEVFNICLDYDLRGNSLCSAEEFPDYFRCRIFVCDTDNCEGFDFEFIELYNSDMVDSVYVDLPKEMQDDSDSSQKSSKRKMGGSISGHTEVKDSEDSSSQKRAKQNNGDSTLGDTEKMQVAYGLPYDLSVMQVPYVLPYDFVEKVPEEAMREEVLEKKVEEVMQFAKSSGNLVNLPLTGPDDGMAVDNSFLVVIHKDTGDPKMEEEYDREARREYSVAGYVKPDYVDAWRSFESSDYDTPFVFQLNTDSFKLQMNCMVMKNTKVVDVGIKWCMPTSYIRGEISVSCDEFLGNKCSLIQTPQNKFVIAEEGEFIELCKITVAVPYKSGFTVKAMLHDCNNALLVNESVSFPFVPLFNEDPKNLSYQSILPMKGMTGGGIEVLAFVHL